MIARHKKLIVIVGPTAVGKTAAAINVARHFGTEIISADSRQLYRELTIGTAKPTPLELATVPHHFVDSHSIHKAYDAAQFGKEALGLLHELFLRHDYLVLCGGSGLYVKAVCEGFDAIPPIPAEIRDALASAYAEKGIGVLQAQLKKLDPDLFDKIDQQNTHRLIRALEVVLGTGKSITSFQKRNKLHHTFSIVKVGLELPKEEMYQRIEARIDRMIAEGLFKEAEELYAYKDCNALQTVGYREIFDFMDGMYDRAEAIRLLKRNSRRYAKRQLTWFKRDQEIVWVNPANIEEIIAISQ